MEMISCPHCKRTSTPREAHSGKCPVCGGLLHSDSDPQQQTEQEAPPTTASNAPWIALSLGLVLTLVGGCWATLHWSVSQQEPTQPLSAEKTPLTPTDSVAANNPKQVETFGPAKAGKAKAPPRKIETPKRLAENRPPAEVPALLPELPLEEQKPEPLPPPVASPKEKPAEQRTVVRAGNESFDLFRLLKGKGMIQELDLTNAPVTDKDLELLRGQADLKKVTLRGTPITGPGLRHLVAATSIDLSRTAINDRALSNLTGLTELRVLTLRQTEVTGPGLALLTGLSSLDLAQAPFTDISLRYLSSMSQLRELSLKGTFVSGAGLERLTGLTFLDLSDTPITDRGLLHLRGLSQLREVDLRGTRVTEAGIQAMRKALPNLRIDH